MHVVLVIAAMHRRYRGTPASNHPSTFESYHVSRCAASLSSKKSRSLQVEDRDIFWMTLTFLGIIAAGSVPAITPGEVWPLKPSDSLDLEWLRVAEGKMEVCRLADHLRPDSRFWDMTEEYAQIYDALLYTDIGRVPPALARLCYLTPSSPLQHNNPYFTAVYACPSTRSAFW
ncbi:hypothetical protein BDV23DRAFT_165401 [Aspergillus alliaceus]|uniref:Uncharacterized protein n=1 Tax=Petromyces alliaceus TaxID=209559 RepID=A0A5N7BTP9_PETAA|nr:hypothetical protein BDV23DRAFT_165401 [Aspergillus alliaceus]